MRAASSRIVSPRVGDLLAAHQGRQHLAVLTQPRERPLEGAAPAERGRSGEPVPRPITIRPGASSSSPRKVIAITTGPRV